MEQNVKDNELNVSFLSGKSFEYFLKIQKEFIYLFENNPTQLFKNLYNMCIRTLETSDFKDFIINVYITEIQSNFDLEKEEEGEDEEEEVVIPKNISKKLNKSFDEVFKKIKKEDKDEIIQSLYNLYYNLKKKRFQ